MGVFNIVKVLNEKEAYAKVPGQTCPKCNEPLYFEQMSPEELDQLRTELMAMGQPFDADRLQINKFCWDCEYKGLKVLRDHWNEMNKEKNEGLENLKMGSTLGNSQRVMVGLNQLTQVFGKFMNLFEVAIVLPEDMEELEETGAEESLIIT